MAGSVAFYDDYRVEQLQFCEAASSTGAITTQQHLTYITIVATGRRLALFAQPTANTRLSLQRGNRSTNLRPWLYETSQERAI